MPRLAQSLSLSLSLFAWEKPGAGIRSRMQAVVFAPAMEFKGGVQGGVQGGGQTVTDLWLSLSPSLGWL